MARIVIAEPEPPFAEIDAAIARTSKMIARLRGRDAVALAMLASSRTKLETALKDLRSAHERTQRSLTGGCDAADRRRKNPGGVVLSRPKVRAECPASQAMGGSAVPPAGQAAATAGGETDPAAFRDQEL